MSGIAVNKAADGVAEPSGDPPATPRHRIRRAAVIGVVVLVVAGVVAALVDAGLAAVGEYRFSQSLRASAQVSYDPEVTLGGFPYVTHASSGTFSGAVITARGVDVDGCPTQVRCRAEMGATFAGFTAPDGWRIGPTDTLAVSSMDVYTRLDSVNLGRMLGIIDLTVNTPAPADKAGGGGPQDGLLRRTTGVLMSGTVALPGGTGPYDEPPSASRYPGPKAKVSVNVDVSVVDGRLHLRATDFYTGPEQHVDTDVPESARAAVLAAFTRTLPLLPLPWQIAPTRAFSEGSDVLIAGTSGPRDVRPDGF